MKIKGEFVMREIAGDILLIPVGQAALKMNAMITLDPVAALIWEAIGRGDDRGSILKQILDRFDVTEETAGKDLDDFLEQMRQLDLLDETND